MRGTLTDLLIGDLFTDRVDKVWAPLESLYKDGKKPIPDVDAGTPAAQAGDKANELCFRTACARICSAFTRSASVSSTRSPQRSS